MIWAVIGWFLVGVGFGYALNRWRVTRVLLLFLLGVAFVAEPSPPGTVDGEWAYTLAIVLGSIAGGQAAERGRL